MHAVKVARPRPHQWGRVGELVEDIQADKRQEVVEVGVVAMQGAGAVAGAVAGEYCDGRTLGRTQQRWNTSPVPESSSLMSSVICVWCNTKQKSV